VVSGTQRFGRFQICGCHKSRGIDMIVEAPHRWPAGNHGTRRFILQRFPFAIVYRELPAAIQVLAIAHARRKPGYWKQRL